MSLPALVDRRLPAWLATGSIVLVTLAAQHATLAMPDIAFFLYAAGRLLDGARLYRDVVELNPPPIFAFNLLVVALARATHVPDFLMYRLASAGALLAVLLLCRRLLAGYVAPDQPRGRRALLLLLVFVLFPLAGDDFGQREQFVLAGFLPYLLLTAARTRERAVPAGLAAGVGLLAGAGIALKPHFALLWLGAEVGRRAIRPESRWAFTAELVAAIGFLLAYAAVVVAVTPEYLHLVGILAGVYLTYLRVSGLGLLALAPGAALVWFALLAALVARRHSPEPRVLALGAIAVAASFTAGAAQQKGLDYHFYPALALATIVIGLVGALPTARSTPAGRLYARVSRILLATMVLLSLGRTVLTALGGTPDQRQARAQALSLADFVRERARGEPIGVLSYHMSSAFPLVNYADVPLASRFPCLWLLAASYWPELGSDEPLRYRPPAAMPEAERLLNTAVREDLLRGRPRLLFVLRSASDEKDNFLRRLQYLRYFGRQPELSALFQQYQVIGQAGEYDVYERTSSAAAASPPRPLVTPLPRAAPPTVDRPFVFGAALFALLWLATAYWDRARTQARIGG